MGAAMKLEIKNISKSYGSVRALVDFSAELTPGIYALLGPNGSGKTTLMHILTDNLKADSGVILYSEDGSITQNVKAMGEEFREKLGFMPQYLGMYPNFTAKQFLQYVANLKGVGEHLKHREGDALIDRQITVNERDLGTLGGFRRHKTSGNPLQIGNFDIVLPPQKQACEQFRRQFLNDLGQQIS